MGCMRRIASETKRIFFATTWVPVATGMAGTVALAEGIRWLANRDTRETLSDEEIAQIYVQERLKLKRYTGQEWRKAIQEYHQLKRGEPHAYQEKFGPIDEKQLVADIEKSLTEHEIQVLQEMSLKRARERIDHENKEHEKSI